MATFKRPSEDFGALVPVKKPKNEISLRNPSSALVSQKGYQRTSNLTSPIMLLTGHDGEVFCGKFSGDGDLFASAGFDRQIFIWSVYGDCDNLAVIPGHNGAITDLSWNTDGDTIYTSSTDKTVSVWDVSTCTRLKKLQGHTSFVNSVHPTRRGNPLLCSGSDDCTVRVWDSRRKGEVKAFQADVQVTCVSFNDTAEQVFSSGIDNKIQTWDMRKDNVVLSMHGHTDTVTGMQLSHCGSYLITNSMDNTIRMWDVRPFAPQERCLKLFQGIQHTFEQNLLRCCWSADDTRISAGSGDRYVYIWDVQTRRLLYKLPGHAGCVNETDFHPSEPIVSSVSSDKKIYLGEIEIVT